MGGGVRVCCRTNIFIEVAVSVRSPFSSPSHYHLLLPPPPPPFHNFLAQPLNAAYIDSHCPSRAASLEYIRLGFTASPVWIQTVTTPPHHIPPCPQRAPRDIVIFRHESPSISRPNQVQSSGASSSTTALFNRWHLRHCSDAAVDTKGSRGSITTRRRVGG